MMGGTFKMESEFLANGLRMLELKKKVSEIRASLKGSSSQRKKEIIRILNITEEKYNEILRYKDWVTNLQQKIERFKNKNGKPPVVDFNVKEVIQRFGENPICYISGAKVSWETCALDHKDNDGSNELDNMGVATGFLNWIKGVMPLNYMFSLFKRVLEYNGFTVIKEGWESPKAIFTKIKENHDFSDDDDEDLQDEFDLDHKE